MEHTFPPKIKECHCGDIADKYRCNIFISGLGHKTYRVFYRCRNCWSRIFQDFCPELDASPSVDVLELIKQFNDGKQQ